MHDGDGYATQRECAPHDFAVILERVQGEGGVIPATTRDFLQRVRALIRERDIPLFVDEEQTGCGLTDTWLALEQCDIKRDAISPVREQWSARRSTSVGKLSTP